MPTRPGLGASLMFIALAVTGLIQFGCFRPTFGPTPILPPNFLAGLGTSLDATGHEELAVLIVARRSSNLTERELLALPGATYTITRADVAGEAAAARAAPAASTKSSAWRMVGVIHSVSTRPSTPPIRLEAPVTEQAWRAAFSDPAFEEMVLQDPGEPTQQHSRDAIFFRSQAEPSSDLIRLEFAARYTGQPAGSVEVRCVAAERVPRSAVIVPDPPVSQAPGAAARQRTSS